jgi:hypothetical protein
MRQAPQSLPTAQLLLREILIIHDDLQPQPLAHQIAQRIDCPHDDAIYIDGNSHVFFLPRA